MKGNFRNSKKDGGSVNYDRYSDFNKGGFNSAPREMHKAVCADCKKECEVPFKPKENRPVFCRDCFSKHKPQRF